MNRLEVILTPALYQHRTLRHNITTVVVDVLRATTSFCSAFDAGVSAIVPVQDLQELHKWRNLGYLTAAERDGNQVDLTDFGNSPVKFLKHNLSGKKLAFSTTNGTKALAMADESEGIVTGAFVNLEAVFAFLAKKPSDVVILCSGWKDEVSLEDTAFAGALTKSLLKNGNHKPVGDASRIAMYLWNEVNSQLEFHCSKGEHYQRLLQLDYVEDLNHCFMLSTSDSVPQWNGKELVKAVL